MPIRYEGATAHFEGACTVEEAVPLTEWLEATRPAAVDLARCTALHTALLQCLLAAGAPMESAPEDAFLRRWVAPLLARTGEAPG
jgi:hypothetical protein